MTRKLELDFLRGVAIILVLIRHSDINRYLVNMGWIGVDLFFVLSGFLVSGLILKEIKNRQSFNLKRFFIRRGFKIYPLFYVTAVPYIIVKISEYKFEILSLIGDLLFMQNYVSEWAYLYGAGWSLAVEEHFYISLSIIVYLLYQLNWIKQKMKPLLNFKTMLLTVVILMIIVLGLRFISNYYWLAGNQAKNITLSHFRIDSLLSGVLIALFYYFNFDSLRDFVCRYRLMLLGVFVLGISWTPFYNKFLFVFPKTWGFTAVYISFSCLLLLFLFDNNIEHKLYKFLSRFLISLIAKIGCASYAIYLIHTLINVLTEKFQVKNDWYYQPYLYFAVTSIISCVLGILLTKYIETPILKYRDKSYPRL